LLTLHIKERIDNVIGCLQLVSIYIYANSHQASVFYLPQTRWQQIDHFVGYCGMSNSIAKQNNDNNNNNNNNKKQTNRPTTTAHVKLTISSMPRTILQVI